MFYELVVFVMRRGETHVQNGYNRISRYLFRTVYNPRSLDGK